MAVLGSTTADSVVLDKHTDMLHTLVMAHVHVTNSSWITGLSYVPIAPEQKAQARALGEKGDGLLVVATNHGKVAWLVPSWCLGLLAAAQARGLSVGRVVCKLIRGKYPSVKIS